MSAATAEEKALEQGLLWFIRERCAAEFGVQMGLMGKVGKAKEHWPVADATQCAVLVARRLGVRTGLVAEHFGKEHSWVSNIMRTARIEAENMAVAILPVVRAEWEALQAAKREREMSPKERAYRELKKEFAA